MEFEKGSEINQNIRSTTQTFFRIRTSAEKCWKKVERDTVANDSLTQICLNWKFIVYLSPVERGLSMHGCRQQPSWNLYAKNGNLKRSKAKQNKIYIKHKYNHTRTLSSNFVWAPISDQCDLLDYFFLILLLLLNYIYKWKKKNGRYRRGEKRIKEII